ncbi:hypothetical protein [Pseudodesulfovibrio pelocollis]|uniref:hypothetical protein n=1 Tax=Pseudodesulfovibrio pelocollis TaxID=3051432 RepID=UPI00255ADB46|nr:hypothetical protein [Pseudodesulfovibrio sp. SB368]
MARKNVSDTAHGWQGEANRLLGANLVGNIAGKKSYQQALRWAREPGGQDAQHGPLAHVLTLCSHLIDEGSRDGRDAAIDAARLVCLHLAQRGVPVRLALDMPDCGSLSASRASQEAQRAVSDMVAAAMENKPPALVAAHGEYAMQSLLRFQQIYLDEYTRAGAGGGVRFFVSIYKPVVAARRARAVARNRDGMLACWRAMWRRITPAWRR